MAQLRVHNFTLSLDGYAAGPHQRVNQPLGENGFPLHDWIFKTASFQSMLGKSGGDAGRNDDLFCARTENVGATIMGRHMFGPIRGPWPDESWRGWWGEYPPFGHDVFVLTDQTRVCVAGGMPNGATRVISYHDPDARPTAKGRIGKPVEFGYKAQVVDNADGLIVDHEVILGSTIVLTSIDRAVKAKPCGRPSGPALSALARRARPQNPAPTGRNRAAPTKPVRRS